MASHGTPHGTEASSTAPAAGVSGQPQGAGVVSGQPAGQSAAPVSVDGTSYQTRRQVSAPGAPDPWISLGSAGIATQ